MLHKTFLTLVLAVFAAVGWVGITSPWKESGGQKSPRGVQVEVSRPPQASHRSSSPMVPSPRPQARAAMSNKVWRSSISNSMSIPLHWIFPQHYHSSPSTPAATRPRSVGSFLRSLSRSQSGEDYFAWSRFFRNKTGGTFLELGALDGSTYSNSFYFEHALMWRGVLVEADPANFQLLAKNRPEQVLVHAAICKEVQEVHYLTSGGSAVRGIYEFMASSFVRYWHKTMSMQKIMCLPLSAILSFLRVSYVDWLSVDVEGAELQVLESIDFSQVKFGVISAEVDDFS
eukprot:764504-Hanusia_phi.AAC.7